MCENQQEKLIAGSDSVHLQSQRQEGRGRRIAPFEAILVYIKSWDSQGSIEPWVRKQSKTKQENTRWGKGGCTPIIPAFGELRKEVGARASPADPVISNSP